MKSLIFLSLSLASAAWAGKFEIVGEGTSTKPAEFIKIDVQMQSECHETASAARLAVDGMTEKALAELKNFAANIPEQLQIAPGANLQQIKSVYIDNQSVVICDGSHSWTSSSIIQFRLDNLQKLANLQDALLRLNPVALPPSVKNTERLTLTLSKPVPGVYAETWNVMSDLALQRAQQNALRQVLALVPGINMSSIELLKVKQANTVSGNAIYDTVTSEGDTAGIGLGSVSVKIAREFTYKVGP